MSCLTKLLKFACEKCSGITSVVNLFTSWMVNCLPSSDQEMISLYLSSSTNMYLRDVTGRGASQRRKSGGWRPGLSGDSCPSFCRQRKGSRTHSLRRKRGARPKCLEER